MCIAFRRSEIWSVDDSTKDSLPFLVEVKHWTSAGGNKWNIYLYLYRDFPRFDKFEDSYTPEYFPFDMHGGLSYHRFTFDEINKSLVVCKKYGCDYMHCNDERFETFSTKEEAEEVFDDAKLLFNQVVEYCLKDKTDNNKQRLLIGGRC